MIIKKIEVFLIDIPLLIKRSISHSEKVALDEVLVRIDTDEGISGWGETGGDLGFCSEGQEDIAIVLQKYMAPDLIGKDPFNITALNCQLESKFPEHNHAKAVLDFALHDLIGKALGQPVYNLLGGRMYQRLKVGWPLYWRSSFSELIENALKMKEEKGIKAFKLKIGHDDSSIDLRNLREVRKALGDDIIIRVDANEGYNYAEAVKILRKMEEFNIQLIEQPVPRWDINSLAQLKQHLNTPLMVDESIFNCMDALEIIKNKAADIFNIKPPRVGGIHEAVKISNIAAAANIPCFVSGRLSTSIGSAAYAHFAFSVPNLIYENEFASGLCAISYDLVENPIVITNGFVELGNLPGLGIRVDEKMISKKSKDKFIIK